jgi:alkanesulfonate monooxygenase SsuD/methylene tetrahydromethanopterin reductase-like flavin-dependent oxidoreductase (luciferase family)
MPLILFLLAMVADGPGRSHPWCRPRLPPADTLSCLRRRGRTSDEVSSVAVSFNTAPGRCRKTGSMKIGIGLPAAVPGADMTQLARYAATAERTGFESVGVIDRLVYDNLDPLIALAAAAAGTSRIHLISTVVNVNWRANPQLLAKQISSVVRLSGGRFTAGLGMGGWPADYEASGVPLTRRGQRLDAALADMGRAWAAAGARPQVAFGGVAQGAIRRAATPASEGWVAPLGRGHRRWKR